MGADSSMYHSPGYHHCSNEAAFIYAIISYEIKNHGMVVFNPFYHVRKRTGKSRQFHITG